MRRSHVACRFIVARSHVQMLIGTYEPTAYYSGFLLPFSFMVTELVVHVVRAAPRRSFFAAASRCAPRMGGAERSTRDS